MFQLRLKELRENMGISQYEFAERLGVAQSTVGGWESGKREPNFRTIQSIADFFNVSIDFLLGKTSFKNAFDLFEHWGYSVDDFEAAFDFGELLKKERVEQGISIEEVSKALGLTKSDVENIEEGLLPLNYDWAERYAKFLDTNVTQLFYDNDMYSECIPPHFKGDVIAYEKYKTAVIDDVAKENTEKIETISAGEKEDEQAEIQTIAAHFKGKEISEEQLKSIKKFIEFTLKEDDK